MEPSRTVAELAAEALAVQDACNIRAVLRSAHQASLELGRLPDCQGTDWINTHPVMVLYASKIGQLAGSESMEAFGEAYDACVKLKDR